MEASGIEHDVVVVETMESPVSLQLDATGCVVFDLTVDEEAEEAGEVVELPSVNKHDLIKGVPA
jgi:hypothetical protein